MRKAARRGLEELKRQRVFCRSLREASDKRRQEAVLT
jgi:hypothetical protein